jgi:hypothetical protein
MTKANETKKLIFPPANADEEAKIRGFLRTTGEFMECELNTELVTIVSVDVPVDRPDIATIVNKAIAGFKKRSK